MKRILPLLLLFSPLCFASTPALNAGVGQSGGSGVQVDLTWTAPACAATISATNGIETSGPCFGYVFRTTITSGSCPAFSNTVYTSVTTTDPILSTAGSFNDTTVVPGTTYCYAVEDAFQAGGAATAPSNIFQIFAIIPGTPGTPTNLSAATAP